MIEKTKCLGIQISAETSDSEILSRRREIEMALHAAHMAYLRLRRNYRRKRRYVVEQFEYVFKREPAPGETIRSMQDKMFVEFIRQGAAPVPLDVITLEQ